MEKKTYICIVKGIVIFCAAVLAAVTAAGQVAVDSAWRPEVKAVTLYRDGIEMEAPVLTLGEGGRLRLQFDLLADEPARLRYDITHCDAAWRRDSLEAFDFMTGFASEPIEGYDFSFTTLRPYVHYTHLLPVPYAEFTHSGNYLLTVYLDGHPDSVYFTRRFYVSEQSVGVEATVGRPYDGVDIDRRQEVDVLLRQEGVLLQHPYLDVRVQQNGRLDNMRRLPFAGYDRDRLAYRQRPANIFEAGNTFRYFDMSNIRTPMYNVQRVEEYGGEYYVLLRPDEDRSRHHYVAETTLNGGMKVNAWDRRNPQLEAEYVYVNFSLPVERPRLDGEVFVVGALTDWRLDSLSRMDYNPAFNAYTKRLLLKQGYYAYQLLFKRVKEKEGKTAAFEGDHREAPNVYTVFVYQRMPADRADRLLAVQRVTAP